MPLYFNDYKDMMVHYLRQGLRVLIDLETADCLYLLENAGQPIVRFGPLFIVRDFSQSGKVKLVPHAINRLVS